MYEERQREVRCGQAEGFMSAQARHILIVEDEQAIADTLVYALPTEGFATTHCLLGREGLARVADGGVDLMILDIGLPDLSGFEICRELRRTS